MYFVRGQEYFQNSTSIVFINYTVNIANEHFEIISFHWIADSVLVIRYHSYPFSCGSHQGDPSL